MLIIGLDFETTGLNPKESEVTEIGAVAWDTELNTPVSFFHRFIKVQGLIPPEITDITGITDELLSAYGAPFEMTFMSLYQFLSQTNIYVAHNAPFDRGFLEHNLGTLNIRLENKHWINTVTHVPYPKKIKHKNLTSLAAEHGFINPFPHRAITDVLTMLRVLSEYDIDAVLDISKQPVLTLWARVTYAEKDKAKAAGFYYDGTTKSWYKEILEKDLEEEKQKCAVLGFAIEVKKRETQT